MTTDELALEVLNEPVFVDAPPRRRRDYLALIEAAYDVTSDDGTWLLEIVRAASPILDSGFGVTGQFWALSPGKATVRHPVYVGCSPAIFEAHMNAGAKLTAAQADALFLIGNPCKVIGNQTRDQFARPYSAYRAHVDPEAFIHISAADVTRRGCAITAPRVTDAWSPAVARAFAQVTRHIVAGMRLRGSLRGGATGPSQHSSSGADAVLDPKGRLLHAEPSAAGRREREGLIDAVGRLLDSRRVRRSSPEQAVALWRALVLGRWSLIDHRDRDGKRLLLARRNSPAVHEPGALSEEERRAAALFALLGSNKLVAYELGMAPSTVSEQLKSAARKLGCRDRSELRWILNPSPAP